MSTKLQIHNTCEGKANGMAQSQNASTRMLSPKPTLALVVLALHWLVLSKCLVLEDLVESQHRGLHKNVQVSLDQDMHAD